MIVIALDCALHLVISAGKNHLPNPCRWSNWI